MAQQDLSTGRSGRVTRLGAAALVLAGLVALSASSARRAPVLRAERIELVSPDGVPQAVLAADSAGFLVTVLDPKGRPVAALRLNGEPWLAVQSGNGREVAGLGSPKVHQLRE